MFSGTVAHAGLSEALMYPTAEKPQGFLRKYVFVAPSNPIDASIRSSWKRFRRAAFLVNTVPVDNRDRDTTFEPMRRQRVISDADLARRGFLPGSADPVRRTVVQVVVQALADPAAPVQPAVGVPEGGVVRRPGHPDWHMRPI